jgi:Bacterial lectin
VLRYVLHRTTRPRVVRTRFALSLAIAGTTAAVAGCPDFDAVSRGGPPCDGGIRCGDVCVDIASDPKNCGTCGNACATGRCGVGLAADMMTRPPDWVFNSMATYDGNTQSAVLTLISTHGPAAGTVVYARPLATDTFDLTFDLKFDFRMGFGGGSRADGMGFMVETAGVNAVGTGGAGLGMIGTGGYGVEFDIFNNAVCGDSSANHVGIDSLGPCVGVQPTNLGVVDLGARVDLGDGQWHAAEVQAVAGKFTVLVDGTALLVSIPLQGFTSSSPYYFGFSGSVGAGGGYRSEVRKVQLSFTSPRCL